MLKSIKNVIKLISVKQYPIFEQLLIEEALMRCETKYTWIILNQGTYNSIIMGASGKPEKLVHIEKVKKDSIPLIKRFTGGGTVFLDKNTMICSIIGKHQLLQRQTLFPRDIMRWSANFYKQAFKDHLEDFKLEADDYVIGDRKIGGNAQYITGGKTQRFVHHTSFLYDFDVKNMEYLLLPDKIPEYRRKRDHADFLSTIKHNSKIQSLEELAQTIERGIYDAAEGEWEAEVQTATIEEAEEYVKLPHISGNKIIQL